MFDALSNSELLWNFCLMFECFMHPTELLMQISVPFIPHNVDLHSVYPSFICSDKESSLYGIRIILVALETYI